MSFLLEIMKKHYNGTTIKTTKNAIDITLHLYTDFINPIRILNKLEKLYFGIIRWVSTSFSTKLILSRTFLVCDT